MSAPRKTTPRTAARDSTACGKGDRHRVRTPAEGTGHYNARDPDPPALGNALAGRRCPRRQRAWPGRTMPVGRVLPGLISQPTFGGARGEYMGMLKEFREFAVKGNVIDLA